MCFEVLGELRAVVFCLVCLGGGDGFGVPRGGWFKADVGSSWWVAQASGAAESVARTRKKRDKKKKERWMKEGKLRYAG